MKKNTFQFEDLALVKKLGANRAKLLVVSSTLILFYIFYLLQNLFFVNGLNDFDEYFIRAEQWVNKEWNWGGGPDKLLSFIEYFPIRWFQNDFVAFYKTTNVIIVTLLFVSTGFFIYRKNDVFPSMTWKYCISLFFISMPFFAVEMLTLDASALLGALLILFLSTYNNRYLGWLGLLIYIARPEGIIILFFYLLFFIIDTKKRKDILINFLTCLLLIVSYKVYESKYILQGFAITGDVAFDNVIVTSTKNNFLITIFNAIIAVFYTIPYVLLYGMEILQNTILFLLFVIGLIASVFNKRMYAFYILIFGYAYLYLALNSFHINFDTGTAFKLFASKMHLINSTLEISNGRNMELNLYGHSRYRVFLYPAVAAFIIAGLSLIINVIRKRLFKNIVLVNNTKQTKNTKKVNQAKVQIVEPVKPQSFVEKALNQYDKLGNLLHLPQATALSKFVLVVVFVVLILPQNLYSYFNFSKDYRFSNLVQFGQWKTDTQLMGEIKAGKYSDNYLNKSNWLNDYYKMGFEIRKRMKPNDIVFMAGLCNCNRSFIGEFIIFSGTRYTLLPVCEKCNDHLVAHHPKNPPVMKAEEIEKSIPSRVVFFDRYAIDYTKTFNDSTVRRINQLYQKFDLNMLDSLNIKFVLVQQKLSKPTLNLIYQTDNLFLYENELGGIKK